MLPTNVLQFIEPLTFDALPASDTLLSASADALEGGFADMLQVRLDVELELFSDDGDILPPAGNNLPLLPAQPTWAEELPDVRTSFFREFFDTNPQEPVGGRPREYVGSLTIHGHRVNAAPIETLGPGPVVDAKPLVQGIVAEMPVSVPPTPLTVLPLASPSVTPPATPPVTPLLTPQADSLQLTKAPVNVGVRTPNEAGLPRGTEAIATPLHGEFEALVEQRDTAVPRTIIMRGQENVELRPATRRVTDVGIAPSDSDTVDLEMPPPRAGTKIASDADVTTKLGRDDMQSMPRPVAANASQPGSISVETSPQADTAVRAVADATAIAPKQPSAPLSTHAIAQSIELPVHESGWGKAISERVLMMANGQQQHAEIRLTPAELGPLRVQVAIDEGTANVSFQAQHAVTREAIELAMPRLREMLAEQGLSLGQTSVSDDGVQHDGREDTGRARSDSSVVADDGNLEELTERNVHTRDDDSLVDTFA